jgi:hypothetical protein
LVKQEIAMVCISIMTRPAFEWWAQERVCGETLSERRRKKYAPLVALSMDGPIELVNA